MCNLNVERFPFDSQVCEIIVHSGILDNLSLRLTASDEWQDNAMLYAEAMFKENMEWKVREYEVNNIIL